MAKDGTFSQQCLIMLLMVKSCKGLAGFSCHLGSENLSLCYKIPSCSSCPWTHTSFCNICHFTFLETFSECESLPAPQSKFRQGVMITFGTTQREITQGIQRNFRMEIFTSIQNFTHVTLTFWKTDTLYNYMYLCVCTWVYACLCWCPTGLEASDPQSWSCRTLVSHLTWYWEPSSSPL